MGQDPGLCLKVAHYVVRLLPILFLNSLIRWDSPIIQARLSDLIDQLHVRLVTQPEESPWSIFRDAWSACFPECQCNAGYGKQGVTAPQISITKCLRVDRRLEWHRPTNRILIAQRIALPQALVSAAVLVVHLPITRLATQRFGYVGAAYAYSLSAFFNLVLIWTYVACAGLGSRVWGRPHAAAFKVCPLQYICMCHVSAMCDHFRWDCC